MKRKAAIICGLGWLWLDPPGGMRYIAPRLHALGLIVPPQPFHYDDSQGIHDFLADADEAYSIGDSFGADYQVQDFVGLSVAYVAGFQPSMYATDVRINPATGIGEITVPPNVKYAHCIRDPQWADTGGLGFATYVAADPKRTTIITTEHRGAHPDNYGVMQDLIVAEIRHRVGA